MRIRYLSAAIAVLISLFCSPSFLLAQSTDLALESSPPSHFGRLWSACDDSGIYLVMSKPRDNLEGFQLFFQSAEDNQPQAGRWYTGRVAVICAMAGRVLVFLESGGCHSYSLFSAAQTQPRLPIGLSAISCSAFGGSLYVLVGIDEPGRSVLLPTPEKSDTESARLRIEQGEYAVLLLDNLGRWLSITPKGLPTDHWRYPQIFASAEDIYLFGLDDKDNLSEPILRYMKLPAGFVESSENPSDCEIVSTAAFDLEGITALEILSVDKDSISAILAAQKPASQSPDDSESLYYLANLELPGQWHLTGPLERGLSGEPLQLSVLRTTFLLRDNQVVMFGRVSDDELLCGSYDTEARPTKTVAVPLAPAEGLLVTVLLWIFTSSDAFVFVVGIIAIIVFRYRVEAFVIPPALPPHISQAPLWRRVGAFSVDCIPMLIATQMLLPEVSEKLVGNQLLLEQARYGRIEPEILKLYGLFLCLLVLYQLAGEIILSASPGKKIFGLSVISISDGRPKVAQILLRNVMRFLELHPGVPFMIAALMLVAKRHRRIGDLLAGTVVVLKPPDLSGQPSEPNSENRAGDSDDLS